MPLSPEVIAARKKLGIPMNIIGDPEDKEKFSKIKLLPKTHPLKQAPQPKPVQRSTGMRVVTTRF